MYIVGVKYLFSSERLYFRGWHEEDLELLAKINSNEIVMQYFPRVQTSEESANFIIRMQKELLDSGHCYFAAIEKATEKLIGFIGMSTQDYVPNHEALVDIGWRLRPEYWGKGYATEGAMANLKYGFEELGLEEIYAIAPKINGPSIHVMEKIGMEVRDEFLHPKLSGFENLERCVLYSIKKDTFAQAKS